MGYEFNYEEIKKAPEYLRELGLKPVFVPTQDGCNSYYAFLDVKDNSEVFVCRDLGQLVEEAEKRVTQHKN